MFDDPWPITARVTSSMSTTSNDLPVLSACTVQQVTKEHMDTTICSGEKKTLIIIIIDLAVVSQVCLTFGSTVAQIVYITSHGNGCKTPNILGVHV